MNRKILLAFVGILIIFVAVLFYFDFFSPPTMTAPPCQFSAGFSCINGKIHADTSELDFAIGQGTGYTIKITGVLCTLNDSYPTTNMNYASDPIIMPSATLANISKQGSSHVVICTDANGKPLEYAKLGKNCVRVYLNYTEMETNETRLVKGGFCPWFYN